MDTVVTPEEFLDWKTNLVTKAFFEASTERVEDAKEILAGQAGRDPAEDSFFRGFIFAYREMAQFKVSEE